MKDIRIDKIRYQMRSYRVINLESAWVVQTEKRGILVDFVWGKVNTFDKGDVMVTHIFKVYSSSSFRCCALSSFCLFQPSNLPTTN